MRRIKKLHVLLTDGEQEALKQEAARRGRTISEWVRESALPRGYIDLERPQKP